MKETSFSPSPEPSRVLLAACVPARAKRFGEWRSFRHDMLCLVSDGAVVAGMGTKKVEARANSLVLVHAGERHGFWKKAQERPDFWVLFFEAGPRKYESLRRLGVSNPEERIWRLAPDEVAAYKTLFIRLIVERAGAQGGVGAAESALLDLLLVQVQRWAEPRPARYQPPPVPWPDKSEDESEAAGAAGGMMGGAGALPSGKLALDFMNFQSMRTLFGKTIGAFPKSL